MCDLSHQCAASQPHSSPQSAVNRRGRRCESLLPAIENNRQHIKQRLAATAAGSELTASGLRDNVQIVLNNLHRNAYNNPKQPSNQRAFGRRNMLSSPESDCNSNPHPMLSCSIASSHDFTHDNSDYQWFQDYGYRDGVTHQSILSSLSASYNGIGELSYYEDLAKNIDANLAEVDMESFTFRQPDNVARMQPLTTEGQLQLHNQQQLQLQHLQLQHQQQILYDQHQQHRTASSVSSAGAGDLDNSICAAKQLFSPVKETVTLSVDSLDLDGFGDGDDLILTCQANKDNYTIAFEGSTIYSEESYYGGLHQLRPSVPLWSGGPRHIDDIIRRKALEVSMSHSDTGFTTWSALKKTQISSSSTSASGAGAVGPAQLQRYPSGNNNTASSSTSTSTHAGNGAPQRHAAHCLAAAAVRKSSSLPDLQGAVAGSRGSAMRRTQRHLYQQALQQQLHLSQTTTAASGSSSAAAAGDCSASSSTESAAQLQRSGAVGKERTDSDNDQQQLEQPVQPEQPEDGEQQQQQLQQPAFNLVKLFIKQKSSSSDTCMDVSSGCWPSSDQSPSSSQEQQQQQQRQRKKSMNDSGKGSALSRHDEDMESGDFQYDSLDVAATSAAPKSSSAGRTDLYRECFDSPSRAAKVPNRTVANLNNNNNNSMDRDSLKETTSASLTDDSRTSDDNITQVFAQLIPAELMSRSIQTSMRMSQTAAATSSGPAPSAHSGGRCSHVKVVPPSFLAQLSQNSGSRLLGESQPAPVYVIYPNYALPDLGFVTHSDVILSPLSYTKTGMSPPPSMDGVVDDGQQPQPRSQRATSVSSHTPRPQSQPAQRRRPVSLLDCDTLVRNKQYAHIEDWKSLATLLPAEYRQLMRHIPDVDEVIKSAAPASQRCLFSMSPPLRLPAIQCDCEQFVVRGPHPTASESPASSGGSSSDQRASSGYRGSSTMLLTDSELEAEAGGGGCGGGVADPMRNMYVYQYENNTVGPLPPTGRGGGGGGGGGAQNATPRGILRRMNSKTRPKRNSMFEERTPGAESSKQLATAEKRRSLQEEHPCYGESVHTETYQSSSEPDDQHRLNNSRVFTPTGGDPSAKYNLNYIQELNEDQQHQQHQHQQQQLHRQQRHNAEAAADYYADVTNILQSIEKTTELYDRNKLRSQVSRALSRQYAANCVAAVAAADAAAAAAAAAANANASAAASGPVPPPPLIKKVSFDRELPVPAIACNPIMGTTITLTAAAAHHRLAASPQSMASPANNSGAAAGAKEFSTPPNSPNISVAQLRLEQKHKRTVDQEKLDKIQSNRFKRLQIQWELLSKEAQVLREELGDEADEQAQNNNNLHHHHHQQQHHQHQHRGGLEDVEAKETRSGGSTPTSAATLRSRIPRPVSYPATKTNVSPATTAKQLQSPSRMIAPKRYGSAPTAAAASRTPAAADATAGGLNGTPNRSRTPSKLNTTPKRMVPLQPRTTSARSSR